MISKKDIRQLEATGVSPEVAQPSVHWTHKQLVWKCRETMKSVNYRLECVEAKVNQEFRKLYDGLPEDTEIRLDKISASLESATLAILKVMDATSAMMDRLGSSSDVNYLKLLERIANIHCCEAENRITKKCK